MIGEQLFPADSSMRSTCDDERFFGCPPAGKNLGEGRFPDATL
jgi:hypothetical protein